jgi:hypothetical protein
MRKGFIGTLILVLAFSVAIPSAFGAGSRPKLEVNCGNLLKLQDDDGLFLYFNPYVKITYFGAPLTFNAYYSTKKGEPRSEQGKKLGKVTGKAPSTRKYSQVFDLSHEFLRYGQKSNGYFHMDLEVIDSLKRKSSFKCIFEGDFGFPKANPEPVYTSKPAPTPAPTSKPTSTPVPTPSPTPTELQNDLISLIPYQAIDGSIDISIILRNKTSKKVYFSTSGVAKKTAIKNQFTVQDFWQDKILGCTTFSECIEGSYLLDWGGEGAVPLNFDNLRHPDGYLSRPALYEMEFGKTASEAYALTNYVSPIDGAKSVIYKIDLKTLVKKPVFATYCQVANNRICANGAIVRDLKVDHQSGRVYFVLELGSDLYSNKNNFVVASITGDSPQISIKSAKEVLGKSLWEGNLTGIYTENDSNKSIEQVFPSSGGDAVFFKRGKSTDAFRENEICRASGGQLVCKLVAPFSSIAIVQVIDKSQLLVNIGDRGLQLYNFDLNTQEEVLNAPKVGAILSFGN